MSKQCYKSLLVYPHTHEKLSKIIGKKRTTITKFIELVIDTEFENEFKKEETSDKK